MRNGFRASVLMIGLGCASNSQAQELTALYIGASVGKATNEVGEFKGRDTALKLTGGYAFNQYFAVELSYVDAGTQTDTVGLRSIKNESSGIIASALLNVPLGERFAVFGKLGYAFYDSDATGRLGDQVTRESDSSDDLTYGIGIQLAVRRGLSLRAEYEAVDVSEGDFEIVSAGAFYEF